MSINSTDPTNECIIECSEHLIGLYKDFERRYEDLLEMKHPVWFMDLQNFEPEEEAENPELVEQLLDLNFDIV